MENKGNADMGMTKMTADGSKLLLQTDKKKSNLELFVIMQALSSLMFCSFSHLLSSWCPNC